MPAPNRRNVGASLAQKIDSAARIEALADRRDRQAAHRARHAGQWEEVVARLVTANVPTSRPAQTDKQSREALLLRSSAFASARALAVTLEQPCPVHAASPGEACWELAGRRCACGARIRSAGLTGTVSVRAREMQR